MFLKNNIEVLARNPLISGSLIMLIGTNIYNAGQFIYHFLAIRLLSKAHYGDLASIISLLGIVALIQLSIGLTIVKFIASEKKEEKIPGFIRWFFLWSLCAGVVIGLLAFLSSPYLVRFLKISQPSSVYLLGPFLFVFVLLNTSRAVLQGLLSFGKYVVSLLVEVSSKLVLTFFLITSGFAVFGAMMGLVISIILALVFMIYILRSKIFGMLGKRPDVVPLMKYSIPVFIQGASLTAMYSVDLIIVKHFFDPEKAGLYAALAVLGRVVFFGTSPISSVMFPLISKRFSRKEKYSHIFVLSVTMILLVGILIVYVYYFIPWLPISILAGERYLEGASLLWWFGVFMSLLSLSSHFTQFYLSINKTKIIYIFAVASGVQGILLWFFHSSLLQVIQLSSLTATLLVLSLFVYFMYYKSNG